MLDPSAGQAITGTVGLAMFVVITKQLTNFVKYVRASDKNGIITGLAGFAVSFGSALLMANSHWGSLVLPALDVPLRQLSVVDLLLVGVAGMSGASFLHDRNKAIDNTQTAITPTLFTGSSEV